MIRTFTPNIYKDTKPIEKPVPAPKKKYAGLKRKATGEKEVFKSIWNTRPHLSFVSGQFIGNYVYSWNFSHVLPKRKYPKFRLYERNIVILFHKEHDLWDNARHLIDRNDPRWKRLFDLEAELKKEYDNKYKNKR